MNELGSRLKQAREEKGLSLDDLQTLTKIQKRYLQGIEEGNYSMMPGKFYVRAFIKQYAEAVGIDHEELFENYKAEIPPVYDEQINENISRVQTKKTLPAGSSKVLDLLPKILLGVLVVGVVAVFYLFAQKNAGDDEKKEAAKDSQEVKIEESEDLKKTEETKETSANSDKKAAEDKKAADKSKDESKADEQKNDEKKQEEKATQALAVVSAQGSETAYELKNADKFELTVTTTGETWINILNGKGTSFFQGMLKKGATESQTIDFSKETEAVVVVGRSSDTEIFVNGQKLEYAVPVTEEVRQDITIRYVPPTQ